MKSKMSKNFMYAMFAAAVIMLTFSSCKKYEEGPVISLRTKTARLTAEWKIVESTSQEEIFNDLTFEFDKDGDFSMTVPYTDEVLAITVEGTWEWEDNKEYIKIIVEDNDTKWKVLRLTSSEFWFEDEDNEEYKCERD